MVGILARRWGHLLLGCQCVFMLTFGLVFTFKVLFASIRTNE